MATNYLTAIEYLQPTYVGYTATNAEDYSTISWGANAPIAQATLDAAWTASELNQARQARKVVMRQYRDSAMQRTVDYSGNTHEMGLTMFKHLLAAMAYVNGGNALPGGFEMALSTGATVAADAAYVEGLLGNVVQHYSTQIDTYTTKCAAIDAAADVAAVNAITWS